MSTPAKSRYLQIADALRERIREGEYGPNMSLPSERKLTVEFEASRTTIRDALRRLVAEGLITASQGRSYQ
ncbi:winged helix-turn-helix domain-containing protein, partial [Streptomyces xiamenensis]|uniref:winged helix-turn-helix domain-containing protein n=1 Tax=Streptomyces xiamenensis TaxID=408015 RepID=UPI0035E1EF2A